MNVTIDMTVKICQNATETSFMVRVNPYVQIGKIPKIPGLLGVE